jgi:hypothetical protein
MKPSFFQLLKEIKTNSQDKQIILNQIRLQLFVILHNKACSQNDDQADGLSTLLASLDVKDIDNFLLRLEKEKISFTPNNEAKISNFFFSYIKRAYFFKVKDIQRKKAHWVSLDAKVVTEENLCYLDILADDQPTPEEYLINSETQALIDSILTDPELINTHPKGHQICNLATILTRKLQQKTFQDIASEFKIKLGTLTSFYHRNKPLLREKLQVLI